MESKIIKIYEIISAPTELTPSTIEITTQVFEKLKSVGLNCQTDTILIEVGHDDIFAFVGFVVDQTITVLNKIKWIRIKKQFNKDKDIYINFLK